LSSPSGLLKARIAGSVSSPIAGFAFNAFPTESDNVVFEDKVASAEGATEPDRFPSSVDFENIKSD
jgi:hypothetical protein